MTTQERISNLGERIENLEESIATLKMARELDPECVDEGNLIDLQLELQELEEQLNFAWQDDEAEYNYAVEMQEFNPDGSLMYY